MRILLQDRESKAYLHSSGDGYTRATEQALKFGTVAEAGRYAQRLQLAAQVVLDLSDEMGHERWNTVCRDSVLCEVAAVQAAESFGSTSTRPMRTPQPLVFSGGPK